VIKNAKNKIAVQNAKLVLALVEMQDEEGNKEKATARIEDLANDGNEYAILNRSILEGKTWAELTCTRPLNLSEAEDLAFTIQNSKTTENIAGLKGIREHYKMKESVLSDTVRFGNPRQQLVTYYYEQAKVLENGDKIFITTNADYSGNTSMGVKIGSTEKELKEQYGLPTVILSAAGGWVYNYPKSKMMVVLDQDKRVRKWIIYSEL
jgi:hypothetical protein